MGIGDSIRDAITPNFVKKIDAALTPAAEAKTATPAEAKTTEQAAYEAKTDAMNANNPSYKPGDAVPRAKGGKVKAGGAPMKHNGGTTNMKHMDNAGMMKNVDNSGMTKMKMGCK